MIVTRLLWAAPGRLLRRTSADGKSGDLRVAYWEGPPPAVMHLRTSDLPMTVDLARHRGITASARVALQIECGAGWAWLTLLRAPADHVLSTGGLFLLPAGQEFAVQGFGEAWIRLGVAGTLAPG